MEIWGKSVDFLNAFYVVDTICCYQGPEDCSSPLWDDYHTLALLHAKVVDHCWDEFDRGADKINIKSPVLCKSIYP